MGELRGALFGDRLEALADRCGVLADVGEAWQLGEALEPEDALEERCGAIANRAAAGLPARLCDEAALDEVRNGRVGRDAADPRDVGTGARAKVRNDRERLERGLGEVPLCGTLEEPRARRRLAACGAERPAA